MTGDQKIGYNIREAARSGWTPDWFGATAFNSVLITKIEEFQRAHGLTPDGLCGPETYRRVYTEREAQGKVAETIVFCGKHFPIKWDKVVLWNEPGGLRVNDDTYSFMSSVTPRKIRMFVNHWDVCLSSASCVRVLNDRKVSVHFSIDNDGTIYQLADMQQICWHAGNGKVNMASVGVEISNAFYTKYQDTYVSKGFGPRPIKKGVKVHGGTLEDHLGFYPVQLEALAALWAAVHKATGIPLALPPEDHKVSPSVVGATFSGFVNHYHVTDRKIDCAGLDNAAILDKAKTLC
jgi:hypothetical protein